MFSRLWFEGIAKCRHEEVLANFTLSISRHLNIAFCCFFYLLKTSIYNMKLKENVQRIQIICFHACPFTTSLLMRCLNVGLFLVTISLCHQVTMSLCDYVFRSLCQHLISSLYPYILMSLCHYVTRLLCPYVLYHQVTLSPVHQVTSSVCQLVIVSLVH